MAQLLKFLPLKHQVLSSDSENQSKKIFTVEAKSKDIHSRSKIQDIDRLIQVQWNALSQILNW